jgi:hypothetical protein
MLVTGCSMITAKGIRLKAQRGFCLAAVLRGAGVCFAVTSKLRPLGYTTIFSVTI